MLKEALQGNVIIVQKYDIGSWANRFMTKLALIFPAQTRAVERGAFGVLSDARLSYDLQLIDIKPVDRSSDTPNRNHLWN